ncbi:hypothetical protein GG344DRAFT_74081 [Lentinula edodes]|nr:hypothetical protein GG344DRAFT_74081 [Lentinula edodes]
MPIFSFASDIQFYYADSGVPSISDYTTYFIVHGHSYHAGQQSFTANPKSYRLLVGIFQRLLPVAHQHSHRMIAINRREYPDSTPYTAAELSILSQGSNEERSRLLLGEGTHLALLLDGLIQSLSLPPNIVIIGWSLGTIFTLSMLASITSLSPTVQARLGGSVKKMIMWEPPAHCLGVKLPPTYIPLLDENIAPDVRPLVFMKWVALHFHHGDLSLRHDMSQIDQGNDNTRRTSPFDATSPEELATLTDLRPGARCDNYLIAPALIDVERSIVYKALFDSTTRSTWSGMDVWHLVGDKATHTVHMATWYLKDQVELAGTPHPAILFAENPGASHFYMWEDPEGAMKKLEALTRPL